MNRTSLPVAARVLRALAFASSLSLIAACQTRYTPETCAARSVFGIAVTVKERETGRRIALGSTIVVREGAYIDSSTAPARHPALRRDSLSSAGLYMLGALERPGTYSVIIRKPGYKEWRRDGVVVEMKDTCHVKPVRLTALLERSL